MSPRSRSSGRGVPASDAADAPQGIPVLTLARASSFLLWALTVVVMGVVLWRDPRPRPAVRDEPRPTLLDPRDRGTARAEPIEPLPHALSLNEGEVRLGRRLFYDPRLARGGEVSCASCHRPELGGADGRRRSVGEGGSELDVHTPSAFNAAHEVWRTSTSAVQSLEEHLDRHVADARILGTDWRAIARVLARDPELVTRFLDVYPEGLGAVTARRALLAYERALVTPDAPFDQWLRGKDDALGPAALEGYRLFKEIGCTACHQGVNVGGNMLQPSARRELLGSEGKSGGQDSPRRRKVPGLRNVALTAPYFHDGSTDDLTEAVLVMARRQVGLELDEEEAQSIVRFLESLTGQLPEIAR